MAHRRRPPPPRREYLPQDPNDIHWRDRCGRCGCHRTLHDHADNESGIGGHCSCGCATWVKPITPCATCGHPAADHFSPGERYLAGTICGICQDQWLWYKRPRHMICGAFTLRPDSKS